MEHSRGYTVTVQRAVPRMIAAVHARVPAGRVGAAFGQYLNQVYAARGSGLQLDGQNVFLYRHAPGEPGQLDVEFGVGVTAPFAPLGSVRPIELPIGDVATTTHRGSYAGLSAAHEAVVEWCRTHSRSLAGPSWEIYGHWTGNEADARTDVYYLLDSDADRRGVAGGR